MDGFSTVGKKFRFFQIKLKAQLKVDLNLFPIQNRISGHATQFDLSDQILSGLLFGSGSSCHQDVQ